VPRGEVIDMTGLSGANECAGILFRRRSGKIEGERRHHGERKRRGWGLGKLSPQAENEKITHRVNRGESRGEDFWGAKKGHRKWGGVSVT